MKFSIPLHVDFSTDPADPLVRLAVSPDFGLVGVGSSDEEAALRLSTAIREHLCEAIDEGRTDELFRAPPIDRPNTDLDLTLQKLDDKPEFWPAVDAFAARLAFWTATR